MPEDDDHLVSDEVEGVDETGEVAEKEFLDRFRGGGVGTEDENLVGNVGPTDIPPGMDGDALRLESTDQPVDNLEV